MVKKVGSYQLDRKIGEGNYGTVFIGVHSESKQVVAAKSVLLGKLNPKLIKQMEAEIAVLKGSNCPSIIKLYDVLKTQNNIYLIMEFCAGGDLEHYVKIHGRVAEPLAKKWLSQLVEAFIYLQEKRIMHRDLKLANILLTSENENEAEIRVADFGFARILNENSLAITQLGTPMFMAPEIFNSDAYSFKADVWSLGVLSYEILLGAPAFLCRTLNQLRKLQKEEIKFPENSPLSDDAKNFIRSMLTYNHNERPSFQELRSHPFFQEIYNIPHPIQPHEIAASPEIHMEDPPKEEIKEEQKEPAIDTINEEDYEILEKCEVEDSIPEKVEAVSPAKKVEEVKIEPPKPADVIERPPSIAKPPPKQETASNLVSKTTDLDYQASLLDILIENANNYSQQNRNVLAFAVVRYCKIKYEELFNSSEKIAQDFSLTRSRDEMFSELYDKIQMQLIIVGEQAESLEARIKPYSLPNLVPELVEEGLTLLNTNEQAKIKLSISLFTIAAEIDPNNAVLSDLMKSAYEKFQKGIRDQY
ncbi:unnamed protein product [Blepharisma stoltei]|uniref:Protein kinase domain-containing protein n=1 Tax=Blepharisma stoltei TaxID=1481888 RepID=A0AAU9IF22_9CILI|nr:unnamed protein product [Blepharisma stoltei]